MHCTREWKVWTGGVQLRAGASQDLGPLALLLLSLSCHCRTIDRSEGHKIDRVRFVDPAIRLSLLFCQDFPLGWPIGKLNIEAQTAAAIRTSLRDDWFDARISVSRLSFPFPFRFRERRGTLVVNSVLCVIHSWNFVFAEFCRVCFVHWIAMHGVSFLVSGICNADFYFYSSR